LCGFSNRTPSDYHSPLGAGNVRGDKYTRPELHKGAYEIVAPKEYIKKPIENVLLMLCIEYTAQSVNLGVYQQILTSLQSIIDSIPAPERTDIAIVTYDTRMNFYNIPSNLASEPSLIVVSDLDDVNIPLPREKLFLNI
jgi:protein transport protein SEC24